MRKKMTILKKHAGVIVLSIASLLLLVGAGGFLYGTDILSAKAEETVASPSDVSGEEIVVPGDLVAMATANLDALADGDAATLTEVPFTITHKDADGNDVPMILNEEESKLYNNTYGPFKWRIFDMTPSSKVIYDNIDPRNSEFSGNLTAGHTIHVEFNYTNTIHHVDWDKIKIYVSGSNQFEITYKLVPYNNNIYGTMQYAEFIVPENLVEGDTLVINAPYVNMSRNDMHALTIEGNANATLSLFSMDSTNALDRMYSSVSTDFTGINSRANVSGTETKYVFAGGSIRIQNNINSTSPFTLDALKAYAADESGEFTVDKTAEVLTASDDGKNYYLTMPAYDIRIKLEVSNTLIKNEIIVNSPNSECANIYVSAGRDYGNGRIGLYEFNTNAYLFAAPEKSSGSVAIDGSRGEFWTNPEGALKRSDVVYNIGLRSRVTGTPSPYELKDVKVEALGDDGSYTDVTSEVIRDDLTPTSSNAGYHYIMFKPYNASLRITCTLEQKPAYNVYFSETLAADGSKLYNAFYGNFLNADGQVANASSKAESSFTKVEGIGSSGTTYLVGKICRDSDLYYKLFSDDRRDNKWTTLKSITVWRLDENGNKMEELDGYLPDTTNSLYSSQYYYYYGSGYDDGNIRYFSKFKQPMPESDILIEVSYGESKTPVTVKQYVVNDDGTETPAGEDFSATFSGTPSTFGGESYTFVNRNGSEIARADAFENFTDITKSNSVTAVSTDAQSQYYFYRRRNTSDVSIALTMPDGYTANISGILHHASNTSMSTSTLAFEKGDNGNIVIKEKNPGNHNQYSEWASWDITIRYVKYTPITVEQKTSAVVPENNAIKLGTVTVTRAADSTNTTAVPFAGLGYTEKGRTATVNVDGTSDKVTLTQYDKIQTNTFTAALGTKLQIQIKPDAQSIIKSVKAYVTENGAERDLGLTADTGATYTTATYTTDEEVAFNAPIRIEVEYASADKITVEVLSTDDTGKLVANNIGATVTVKGSGALTEQQFQYVSSHGNAWTNDFTVTTKETVSTIGETKLDIHVDLPENSDYVVANVYAYQMNADGNPVSGGTAEVLPGTITAGDFSQVRDYSDCTLTMPGSSVYIKVFLAKMATINVSFQARNDDGEFSTANIPTEGETYITYTNTSTQYGDESYPVIVENQYNVGSYTLTNDPAMRTVKVVENCKLTGDISFPRGYVIASVVATEKDPEGNTKALRYNLTNNRYIQKNGKYYYEAGLDVTDLMTKAGYTYDVTVNLELATNILFESYHTTQDGEYALNQSECRAVLNGVRTNDDPAYASTLPFASKTTNSASQISVSRNSFLSLSGRTNRYDYFVLQGTTLTIAATPDGEDVVSDIKVYYEDDKDTLYDVTQTGKSEDGKTTYYSVPVKPALNRILVVQVYFSADLTGNLTIINRMIDSANSTSSETAYIDLPAECADGCYTQINISNTSYSKPIYYEPDNSWFSSTKTSAPNISYRVMSSSSGGVTAYAGSGYILESCEISYDGGITFTDNSSKSGSSVGTKSKSYSLGRNNFTSDKKIVVRNTYRKGADVSVYEHRDLDESVDKDIVKYLFTATNSDQTLSEGPLYIENRRYTDSYSSGASRSSFMIAENSQVSLTVYEPKDLGYIIDRVVLTKDGDADNAMTLTRDQFSRKFNGTTCELLWEDMINKSEYLTGSGYRVDIYYKADYVLIREECVDRDTGETETCWDPGRVTFEVEWPDSNDLIKDRKGGVSSYADDGDRFEGSTDTGLDLLANYFYVGLLEGGTKYNVKVTTNNSHHRIKEIWYGESESTVQKYTAEDFKAEGFEEGLDWGENYTFSFDKGKVTENYYFKVIYEHYFDEVIVDPVPQPEKNRGLLTINVYREKEDGSGYELSTVDRVTLDFLIPNNSDGTGGTYDYTPKVYENETFNPLTPREDGSSYYDFKLPYKNRGSAMFSLVAGTYVEPVVATPNDAYRLDKVVFINQSTGQSAEKKFERSNGGEYTMVTSPEERRIRMTESNYALNFYISMPTVEVGTNNAPGSPKGTVSLKASSESEETTEVMTSTDYMKAFKFSTGSNLELTATPLEGYEFAYILVGDTRSSMTVYDHSKITIDEDTGAAKINLGSHFDDVYVQIQFRSIINTNYSQINVAHYIKNESGDYVLYTLDTGGKVHVMGTQSSVPEPFLINDTTYSSFDLTTEGTRSADVVVGTSVTASVTAPENGIVSAFKATYYDASGIREYTVTKDEANTYKLPEYVGDDSTVSIEVYYDTGYRIYYHGNGASGTVPSDKTIYYSGDSATVLGQGNMTMEHHTFAGWSLMNGSDKVDYKEGDTVTFADGDINLYAVWVEDPSYRVIYHADDKESGSVPIDGENYYLNDEATVLDNPEADPLKKTGYTFAGWSLKKADDGTVSCKAGDKIKVSTENLTTVDDVEAVHLYVVWTEHSYKLTYDKNTSDTVTDMPDPLSVSWKHSEVGENLKLSDKTPTRMGYTFKEWNTQANGEGDSYAKEANFTKVANDVTLYAIWEENSYKIDYQPGTGHSSAVIPNDEEGLLYTDIKDGHALSSQVPTDTGYTFAGWQVNDVEDKLNPGGNVPWTSFDNDSKTATAVATWTINSHWVMYEITIPNDINYKKPDDEQKNFGETVDVANAPTGYNTKKYTFSGWSSTDVTITNGRFTMPDKDVIIRGSFTENGKVTLTYDANGATSGTAPDSVSDYTEVTETIKDKGNLVRTGYTFDGWNASPDGNGTIYAVGTKHTFKENTTIYAKWIPNEYNVRYYDIDGNEFTDLRETHTYGTDFTVRPNGDIPNVTGKKIKGWKFKGGMSTDANGTRIGGSGTYKMPAGDVEFQAEYEDIDYIVTYQVSNAPSGYEIPEAKTYKYEDSVTVADIPNIEGYNFIGWTSEQVDVLGTSFTMPAENVLITGVFTAKDRVTLIYDANGATSGTVPASVTAYDKVVEKIKDNVGNLEKTGYTFDGWKDAEGTDYKIGNEYTFTKDTVLYAQWKKASFKVEYYEADGTTLITTHTYAYQDPVNVGNGVIPTIIGEGKVWNGKWVLINPTQRDADNVEIGTRNNYPMPAETVKYKAVLDAKTYTVTYIMEGDKPSDLSYVPPTVATYNHGDTVNAASVPTGYDTSKYTFTGWDYNESGVYYAEGTSNASFKITENVVLKGVWEKKSPAPDKIKVTYISGVTGDDITDLSLNITRYEDVISGNDYTVHDNNGWTNYVRPGYRFVNWKVVAPEITGFEPFDNLIARFAGPAVFGQTFDPGDTITALSEDITLEAQWELINYTVIYYGNGATGGTAPVDGNSYSYNDTAVVKDKNDLVKDGFTFKGWSTSPLGTGATLYLPNDEIVITSDVILYAIWTTETNPRTYRVFYDGNGATSGNVPEDNTIYNGGETVTVKDKGDLEKDGCTFKEWNTRPDGSGISYNPNDTFVMPKNDVVLYAIWIDSNGNVVVSPGTGESNFGTLLALNISIVSLIAIAIITVRMLKKRRKNAAC